MKTTISLVMVLFGIIKSLISQYRGILTTMKFLKYAQCNIVAKFCFIKHGEEWSEVCN